MKVVGTYRPIRSSYRPQGDRSLGALLNRPPPFLRPGPERKLGPENRVRDVCATARDRSHRMHMIACLVIVLEARASPSLRHRADLHRWFTSLSARSTNLGLLAESRPWTRRLAQTPLG